MQLDDTIPFLLRYFRHHNPFIQDVEGVLAIARKATLTNRGGFLYSNLGVALLGHALAAAAPNHATRNDGRVPTESGVEHPSHSINAVTPTHG